MRGTEWNGLAELGEEVASSLERAREARGASARVREKLVTRQVPKLRAGRFRGASRSVMLGGAVLAAALLLGVGFFASRGPRTTQPGRTSPEMLSFVVGDGESTQPGTAGAFLAAPSATELPLTFSDGSKVRLAPSARARVSDVARTGARVRVESGDLHVAVVHRDDTKWSVEAGPFEVRVTGTKFDVHWDPTATALVVRLHEGSVYVRGCDLLGDEGRLLGAGEELEVSCKDRVQHVRPIGSAGIAAPPPVGSSESSTAPPSSLAPSASASSVREPALGIAAPPAARTAKVPANAIELSRRGDHVEAIMAAEAVGFPSVCDTATGAELLLLADSARYAGRFERATQALEAARRRFPGTDAAATAAFELGRIAMDVRRDLALGGDHFETYLRERPNGNLAREALGRGLEARHRSGDNVRAEPLAVRYLAVYPDGPFAKLARKINTGNQP